MIFSCGCRTDAEALFCAKTSAKERLPRRPQYIRTIIITCDIIFRSLVIPTVIPTVPIAESTSNSTSSKFNNGCNAIMTIVAMIVSVALMTTTAFAFFTTSSVSRLPKRLMSSLFNTIATA